MARCNPFSFFMKKKNVVVIEMEKLVQNTDEPIQKIPSKGILKKPSVTVIHSLPVERSVKMVQVETASCPVNFLQGIVPTKKVSFAPLPKLRQKKSVIIGYDLKGSQTKFDLLVIHERTEMRHYRKNQKKKNCILLFLSLFKST